MRTSSLSGFGSLRIVAATTSFGSEISLTRMSRCRAVALCGATIVVTARHRVGRAKARLSSGVARGIVPAMSCRHRLVGAITGGTSRGSSGPAVVLIARPRVGRSIPGLAGELRARIASVLSSVVYVEIVMLVF